MQRISEEFQHGQRVAELLRPLLITLRDNNILKPIRIVDIGCGTGFAIRWLASQGDLGSDVELIRSEMEMSEKGGIRVCTYCDIDNEEELIDLNKQDATGEESEEDPFLCEYLNEDTDRLCGQPAHFQSKFRYVEEHLCSEHLEKTKEELEEGLMEFQASVGLFEGLVVKNIEPGETCDYTPPLDLSNFCGKPALFAKIAAGSIYLCKLHKNKGAYK